MLSVVLFVATAAIVQGGPTTTTGKACTIPFVYEGKTYDACTSVDASKTWCATGQKNYETGSGNWGYCCLDISACKLDCSQLGGYAKDQSCDTCKCALADPCTDNICGGAKCSVKAGKAECSCESGYEMVGSTCVFVPKCSYHYTPWNTQGNRKSYYLDRHEVLCPKGTAMTYFHLERNSGYNKLRYKYRCCSVKDTCESQSTPTAFNSDGGGNTVYLDRHQPNCGDKGLISYMHFDRSKDLKKVRYEITCCGVKSQTTCYTANTAFTTDGGGKVEYLDRQTVNCKDGHYLSYVWLNRNRKSWKSYRYTYRCCKLD